MSMPPLARWEYGYVPETNTDEAALYVLEASRMVMTYQFAVFGDPIGHSKSPEIHRRFGEQLFVDVVYNKVQVKEPNESEVARFFANGGNGLSITVPHKWSAFQLASSLSDEALLAGACNTLMPNDNGLYGHNTDGLGLLDDSNGSMVSGWSTHIDLGCWRSGCRLSGLIAATNPDEIVIANRSTEKLDRLVGRCRGAWHYTLGAGFTGDLLIWSLMEYLRGCPAQVSRTIAS